MSEDLWAPYEAMADYFGRHVEDSAYNAHYDRPAVLDALGQVAGRRVLDEPRPAHSMQERYPDDYAKLLTEPGFLCCT